MIIVSLKNFDHDPMMCLISWK